MKKAVYAFITAMTLVSVLAACGKKSEDNGGNGGAAASPGGTFAQTPDSSCNIPGSTTCTPNQYSQFGNQFINYQWTNNGSFCGCPAGYRPIMNPQWGLSCAPDNYFPNYSYGNSYQYQYQAYSYSTVNYYEWYSQNGQISSIPQVTYSPGVSGQNGGCYAQAAAVCDIRAANTCANGSTCRASAGGSYLGFCTAGYGNESYSNPQNCYQRQYNSNWGGYAWVNICTSGFGFKPGAGNGGPR
jgi:hypothetical protein